MRPQNCSNHWRVVRHRNGIRPHLRARRLQPGARCPQRRPLRQLAAELEKAHGARSLILAADLSDPGAPAYVLDQTTRADIPIDMLVNNAGFGQYGYFAENDLEECLRQIQLNVTALTHLTRLYLPAMIERSSGRILNVASTAAFQPGPLMADILQLRHTSCISRRR